MVRRFLSSAMRIAVMAVMAVVPATFAANSTPVHQLRIYQIFDNNKSAFHDRFRDHAARIMARYDLPIVAMWESKFENRTEFVYLLQWPDEATMKDRWAKFMADAEWAQIKKETAAKHGTFVGGIEDRTLTLVPYSPQRNLLPQKPPSP